jgi:hypothetical protein
MDWKYFKNYTGTNIEQTCSFIISQIMQYNNHLCRIYIILGIISNLEMI